MAIRIMVTTGPDKNRPEDFASKEEYERFLAWLKEKETPVIDHRVVTRGVFNRYQYDYAEEAERLLKLIKNCENVEKAYDAVSKYGSHYNNSKTVREKYKFLRYKEEMEPYLREIGVPEEVLPNLCDVIPAGGYKAYCRDRKPDKTLIPFGDIDEWARGVKWLISWNYIITYFPTEVRSMRELEEMKRT